MNLPSAPAVLKWLFGALLLTNFGLLLWGLYHLGAAGDADFRPLPPVNAEKMVPLTVPGLDLAKRSDDAGARARPAPSLSPVKPERPAPPLRCLSIGPFDSTDSAGRGERRLGELHLGFVRREETRREVSSYWVHLPPLASRQAAEARLKELKQLGVKEAFVMQEPGRDNAISLGLFSQADNARGLMKELEAKGVKAEQETRYRDLSLVWLEISTPVAEELVTKLRREDWGAPRVEVATRACEPETPAGGADAGKAGAPPAAAPAADAKPAGEAPPDDSAAP